MSPFCGVLAAAIPLGQLADATNIGTLFAFALVNVAVVVLRKPRPEMPHPPGAAVAGAARARPRCVWMMGGLDTVIWGVFGVWMAVGLVFYFSHGYRRSRLATSSTPEK